jgi:outer membrane lipoprotein-sorting protein
MKMNKKVFISIIMTLAVISVSSAQNVDQILNKHFEAVGQKNLLKINSLQSTGKAISMGMEMNFSINIKRPDKIRILLQAEGAKIIRAFDGETVWQINPMIGISDPVDMTGSEVDALKENADIDGQLWQYKEKGYQLALEGTEEVNGNECYVLKLTKKNGNTDYYYLNKVSYLVRKVRTTADINGTPMGVDVLLSNYQEVDGYMMPFTTEQQLNGQTMMTFQLEKMETNMEMDDSIFSKPAGN